MSNVSGVIKSIQDLMRKDVGVDGDAQRISQLVWMFFLKIYDDREKELELLEDDYKSPIPKTPALAQLGKRSEGITGDEFADFVNLAIVPNTKRQTKASGPTGRTGESN